MQKLKDLLLEGTELKVGRTVILPIPYGTSKLRFDGILVFVDGKQAKVNTKPTDRNLQQMPHWNGFPKL